AQRAISHHVGEEAAYSLFDALMWIISQIVKTIKRYRSQRGLKPERQFASCGIDVCWKCNCFCACTLIAQHTRRADSFRHDIAIYRNVAIRLLPDEWTSSISVISLNVLCSEYEVYALDLVNSRCPFDPTRSTSGNNDAI